MSQFFTSVAKLLGQVAKFSYILIGGILVISNI